MSILFGAQVNEIAAVGVGVCAATGVATKRSEHIYSAHRKMERFSGDMISPNKEAQLRHTHNHLGRMNRKSALD